MLRLIENARRDVELIAMLRSPVVGLSADELARIRIACRNVAYVDAADAYAREMEDEIAEKLTAFFTIAARNAGNKIFSISMNRDDMAAYIGTNRSALSRALAEMKREGILDYYRNSFQLH